jgi:hypothetical protein
MEMKAAVEAKAKVTVKAMAKMVATARATTGADRQAWRSWRALPPGMAMPENLAVQAGPTWAISAPDSLKAQMKAYWLAHHHWGVPPPEAAFPEAWAAQAGQTWAVPGSRAVWTMAALRLAAWPG